MIKILVLDDSNVIRSLLQLTLESDGIQADLAETVDQALALAMKTEYDMMIIDYMLGEGHNGLELVEAIQSNGKNVNTPTVMLSAEDGDETKSSAQNLGVKVWMKKPFTPQNMLKVIYKVIDKNVDDANKRSIHHRN